MIRMGLIGCGTMAKAHITGLKHLADKLTFTALVDIDAAKIEALKEHAPRAATSADYTAITHEVDAVIIALPHDLHHAVAKHFLAAGKHVMLEKPLALTEEQCLELIDLDRTPDPTLMVGYVMRYDPLWQKFGELITSKTFGDVFQLSIWTEQYTDLSRGEWMGQAARLGGGQLFSHGCHYIDLMLQWLGKPIEGTHMGTNFGTPWMEREGTSNVTIKFENNVLGYHFGTWGARGSRLGYAVHAHCTGGMLELDHQNGTIILHNDQSGGDPHFLKEIGGEVIGPKETLIYRLSEKTGKAVGQQILEFIDCIENKKKPTTSAQMALESLRVIWRLYEAEDQGTIADLRGIGFD